jgi:DNA-binding MarR family transcriptional regulator
MRPADKKETQRKIEITEPEMLVLRAIRDHSKRREFSPSFVEIAELVGRKKSTIRATLRRLIRKGYITKDANKHRSLKVTPSGLIASRKRIAKK